MLIVSRKKDESIIIDGGITIKILEVSGQTVKIGIEAPKETLILRDELLKRVQDENILSAVPNENSELLDSLVSSLAKYKRDL